jgi:hypothetical protein
MGLQINTAKFKLLFVENKDQIERRIIYNEQYLEFVDYFNYSKSTLYHFFCIFVLNIKCLSQIIQGKAHIV